MKNPDSLKPVFTLTPAFALSGAATAALPDRRLLFAAGTGGSNQDEETVHVQRRRQTETGPEGRERAEAPQRRRTDGGGTPPPTGGSGGGGGQPPTGGSGGGVAKMPGGCGGLALVVIVLILGAFFGVPNILNQGQSTEPNAAVEQPTIENLTTAPTQAEPTTLPAADTPATPVPAPTKSAAGVSSTAPKAGQTWTVMLYQDADDKVLEKDIYVDLNEAERVGSTDRVNIVTQIDRFKGGFDGDGNWTNTRRYYLTRDDDLQRVRSQQVGDVGEANMADGGTLVDFVSWSMQNYPADRYVLILSDHGMGWPGGWSDPAPGGAGDPSSPMGQRLGNELYLNELDDALATIQKQTGLDKFELIGMDACLMAHLEVFDALEPYASYAVASQETEPALGWAYTSFLSALTANPDMSGRELAKTIVDSYIRDDQRIVDDQARADLTSRGGFGAPSASDVANQMGRDITLTAADLSAMPALDGAVNDLAFALQGVNQKAVAQARTYAQAYTSIFGPDVPASYIDLGNFVGILKKSGASGALGQAIDQVAAALKTVVIAEKHGPNKPGSTGVSVYFPNSELYRNPVAGPQSYTVIARRFANSSLWDDFLAYHYTGRDFDAETRAAAVPASGVAVRGPGAGTIEVDPITLSANTAAPGKPVLMSTRVNGQNIGHIYTFTGYFDKQSNSIQVADTDFLESPDSRQVDGVYYPAWPESGQFKVEFDWEPLVFAVSDGTTSTSALLSPESYGAAPDQATYTVDGMYRYAGGGDPVYARLHMSGEKLQQVFGFTEPDGSGAPREIVPQAGDTFTVLEKWMDLGANGQVSKVATQEGGTLTFGDQPFTWKELDAAPGDYVVGFIVEDLDGNTQQTYAPITVE